MDVKKLAHILFVGGLILLGVALYWWNSFYGAIARSLGGKLSDTFSCLYSNAGACGFVSGVAQFIGQTPYNPIVFWAGVVSLCVGGLMKATLKP